MNKETLDILNELTKKPITELAMSYMEVVADNMIKDKEIARLNYIIDELQDYLAENIRHSGDKQIYGNVYYKLQELKEEGK